MRRLTIILALAVAIPVGAQTSLGWYSDTDRDGSTIYRAYLSVANAGRAARKVRP